MVNRQRKKMRAVSLVKQVASGIKLITIDLNLTKWWRYFTFISLVACGSSSARTYITPTTPDAGEPTTSESSHAPTADGSSPMEVTMAPESSQPTHDSTAPTNRFRSGCGARLVLSELMIDPAATKDALGEYLEVYNPTDTPVDLRGWTLSDGSRGQTTFAGDVPIEVPASGFAVIAASTDPDENGDLVHVVTALGKVELANNGGLIQLRDPCGTPTFRVRYGVRAPWPRKRAGVSIELRSPHADPSAPESWIPAKLRSPSGDRGSPGRSSWKSVSERS